MYHIFQHVVHTSAHGEGSTPQCYNTPMTADQKCSKDWCDLPVYSAGFCILHHRHPGKDRYSFLDALKRKLQDDAANNDVDIVRLDETVFPGDFSWSDVWDDEPFPKPIFFADALFIGKADFGDAYFTQRAYFDRAHFTQRVSFVGAQFTGETYFDHAHFTDYASFVGAQFTGEAYFAKAQFSQTTSFLNAHFIDYAYFDGAKFTCEAYFRGAKFTGGANFDGTHFTGEVSFTDTVFSNEYATVFEYATFSSSLRFRRAKFPFTYNNPLIDTLAFSWWLRNYGAGFSLGKGHGRLIFRDVVLDKPEEVFFERVDLSRTLFLRTNVSQVNFVDVTWAKRPAFRILPIQQKEHNAVFDHLVLDSQGSETEKREDAPTHKLVAELYRQLRINLEASKQEVEATHFYIGQMDMRCRDKDTFHLPYRFLLSFYHVIAMYGESISMSFIIYTSGPSICLCLSHRRL